MFMTYSLRQLFVYSIAPSSLPRLCGLKFRDLEKSVCLALLVHQEFEFYAFQTSPATISVWSLRLIGLTLVCYDITKITYIPKIPSKVTFVGQFSIYPQLILFHTQNKCDYPTYCV